MSKSLAQLAALTTLPEPCQRSFWLLEVDTTPAPRQPSDALADDQVARLWQRAAECYARAGEFDEVGRIYQQAIKWAPENLGLRLALAENALRDGRLQLASNELERILERDPKHVPALVRMGEVCSQDADYWWNKQAPKYWQKALEIDPKNAQARQFLAEWYIDQAEETHKSQKCDETIQNYQKSLEFRPGNVKVLSELFTCHLCLKRETPADEYIQQALAFAKNLDDYANLIEALLLFDDQFNRAKEVLALAEARLPDIPASFYVDMPGPLLKNHQKEQADFWLQKAIAKAAPKDHVLTLIADMAMDYDEAIAFEYAQKALAARENIGQAHVLLGTLESKRGNKSTSRKHFQEAEHIARQTNDEELEYRIEAARIYLSGPGALMRRLMNAIYPDQDTIRIEVYQGEHEFVDQNTPLGDFLITGLEPGPDDGPAEVTVQFDLDVNGILKVTAHDRKSNRQESISVEASHARMSEPEILAARDWVEEKAGETELAALSDEDAALVRRAETLLSGGGLEDENHKSLSDLLARIQDTRAGGEPEDLEELLGTLEDLLFDLDLD